MGDVLFYIAAFVFVIALIVLGAWLWRTLLENGIEVPGAQLFKAAQDKRIGAIETASIDGRRKLVLIRRDNVEHLIMTGGPVDVVVETGIGLSPDTRRDEREVGTSSQSLHDTDQGYPSNGSLETRLRGTGRSVSFGADS